MAKTLMTIKQVASNFSGSEKLVRGVISNLGYRVIDSDLVGVCNDIARYGISGGFGGFIYYADTLAFYRKFKRDILELATTDASELGTNLLEMIYNFNGMKDIPREDIDAVMTGSRNNDYDTTIKNCLAWYAAEQVAYAIVCTAEELNIEV